MSRYDALTEKLLSSTEPTIILSFEELDSIVGGLPNSANTYGAWWANKRTSQAHAKAWLDAGRRAQPDFGARHVVFTADAMEEPRHWIFQPISRDYSLPDVIEAKEVGDEDEWPVVQKAEEMRPGDQVMLYQMRTDQGVYACGELISEPHAERELSGPYPGTGQPGEQVVRIRYTRILPQPFGRAEMRKHPEFSSMQMMRSSDCINCRVTADEWRALEELLQEASAPRFWWVNQGSSSEQEIGEGYLRAPQTNIAGNPVHFYTSVTHVRPGDVVLHYAQKALRAVGRVESRAQETTIPGAEDRPDDTPGWLVHVGVTRLEQPILLEDIPVAWRTAAMEGGPFNYQGGVNQGYLFPLSRAFAHQFLGVFMDRLPDWVSDIEIDDSAVVGHLKTILKVAPGEQGKYWDECFEGGFICVGWEELDDLRTYASELEIRMACLSEGSTSHEGTATLYARALWAYRNLLPGDIILANRGQSSLLGVGKVVSGYEYRPDRPYYKHVVPVRWDASQAGPIPDQGTTWRHTIVELSPEQYSEITSSESVRSTEIPGFTPSASGTAPFEQILHSIDGQSLHFTSEQVSNYLLGLQAKRFVILTGISGTGKTQLALAVAKHFQPTVRVERTTDVPADALELDIKPYMTKYGQMVIPAAFAAQVHFPAINPDTNGERMRILYPGGEARLTFWKDPDRNVTSISFRGEFRAWFQDQFAPGDQFLLSIVESEDEGPDALRFSLPATVEAEEPLDNVRVIAVRPDWTDNRGLLGFHNPITGQYVTTEFLELLLRAKQEEDQARSEGRQPRPFFVILDEMNLARVEHYFSDFLSAIESGQPIELHHDPALEAGEGTETLPIPRRLEVPRNVFFTGTVNVDETTYMFSPKVLDRAFTLEFNDVDLASFGANPLESDDSAGGLRLDRFPDSLELLEKPDTKDWDALGELDENLRRVVVRLNEILVDHGWHFGYRVANEIARFVLLAARQAGEDEEVLWTALDLAILQKVLPKFHGTQQELEPALVEVFAFAVAGGSQGGAEADYEDWALHRGELVRSGSGEEGGSPRLPRTAAKVWRMMDRVRRQGFASFVE
jgi:hypothetical protein